MSENIDEKTTVITVEDHKMIEENKNIKFAQVHRPERTKTIDTIASRRPSISAPKKPEKKDKAEKKNVDIVSNLNYCFDLREQASKMRQITDHTIW